MYLKGMQIGCNGAVGSSYNFAAPIYHRVLDALSSGNTDEAAQWQARAAKRVAEEEAKAAEAEEKGRGKAGKAAQREAAEEKRARRQIPTRMPPAADGSWVRCVQCVA